MLVKKTFLNCKQNKLEQTQMIAHYTPIEQHTGIFTLVHCDTMGGLLAFNPAGNKDKWGCNFKQFI